VTDEDFATRLRAVERAVTDGDATVADLSEAAAVHDRLDDIEADLAALAERVDALDATVQSLHGYVGEIEHVNERVERRADAARAAVERLEDERQRPQSGNDDPPVSPIDAGADRDGGNANGSPERRASSDLPADLEAAVADGNGAADGGETVGRGGTADSTDDSSLFDRVRESL